MRIRLAGLLFLLALAIGQSARADVISWAFQYTGARTSMTSGMVQTALAMRDRAWPVIFAPDYASNYVHAYSLYPVVNPSSGLNWHRTGFNVLPWQSSEMPILSAATSSDGRFAAAAWCTNIGGDPGVGVVGSSASGFATFNAHAATFNSSGGLVLGTTSTLPATVPNVGPPWPLVDIAVSPAGELAAIDQRGNYYQRLSLAGGWVGNPLPVSGGEGLFDLVMDSLGRPHVGTAGGFVLDFDVRTGAWIQQQLAPMGMVYPITLAADSRGGVGAAWVQNDLTSQTASLQYAYKESGGDWSVCAVASNLYNSKTGYFDHLLPQRLGLAFDANDLPLISFVAGSAEGFNIWLAYDPPIATPEPSTLVLLALGGVSLLIAARKRRI